MAMRKFFLLMLLAGAAGPALARPDNDGSENNPAVRAHRAEKTQSDSDGQKQSRSVMRPQNNPEPHVSVDRSNSGPQVSSGGRDEHVPPTATTNIDRVDRRRAEDSVRTLHQDSQPGAQAGRKAREHPTLPDHNEIQRGNGATATGNGSHNWRSRDHDGPDPAATIEGRNVRTAPNVHEGGGLVQPRHDTPRVVQPTERRVSRRPVFGTEPPAPQTATSSRAHPSRRWSTDWRHDRRYDWNGWRRHHHSKFHLGWYYDPFGWDYFRYGIGWRMWPSYYGNSFWLHDPWEYRLPPAYGPYRWVRYHYDAVLVNIYTGQIADIVYDFFW